MSNVIEWERNAVAWKRNTIANTII